MWQKTVFLLISIVSSAWAVTDNRIDHLDPNSGELLEAYIKNKTTPSSFEWIANRVGDSVVGSLLGFDITGKQLCQICPWVIGGLLLERRQEMTNIQLTGEVSYLCTLLGIQNSRVCLGVIEANMDIFGYIMDNNVKDKTDMCSIMLDNLNCEGYKKEDWTVKIPSGDTVNPPTESGKNPFRILHLSDLHYDPLYKEGKSIKCGEPLCCQEDQNNAVGEDDKCQYWSNYDNSDTPLNTIEAVFEEAAKQTFDYVYLTGDIVSHRVWSTSPEHNRDVVSKIVNKAKDYFKKPVYFVLGNHEGHPANIFAPNNVNDLNSTWLYKTLIELLPVDKTDSIENSILAGGFYTVSPRKGFRLIMMNDNVCQHSNWWNMYKTEDPSGQLKWMVDVLLEAEKNNEWVHILGHIPTGSCLTVWGREFNRIVKRFANTIVGQFYGHTHQDEFYVFYDRNMIPAPINAGWNGASVVPDRSNPSFKVYEVDDVTFRVLDIEEYYFNLTEANENPSQKLNWKKLYSFKDAFGLKSLEPKDLDDLLTRMATDHSLLKTYHRYLHRDSNHHENCDDNCMKVLLCSIVNTEYGETSKCESLKVIYDLHK